MRPKGFMPNMNRKRFSAGKTLYLFLHALETAPPYSPWNLSVGAVAHLNTHTNVWYQHPKRVSCIPSCLTFRFRRFVARVNWTLVSLPIIGGRRRYERVKFANTLSKIVLSLSVSSFFIHFLRILASLSMRYLTNIFTLRCLITHLDSSRRVTHMWQLLKYIMKHSFFFSIELVVRKREFWSVSLHIGESLLMLSLHDNAIEIKSPVSVSVIYIFICFDQIDYQYSNQSMCLLTFVPITYTHTYERARATNSLYRYRSLSILSIQRALKFKLFEMIVEKECFLLCVYALLTIKFPQKSHTHRDNRIWTNKMRDLGCLRQLRRLIALCSRFESMIVFVLFESTAMLRWLWS